MNFVSESKYLFAWTGASQQYMLIYLQYIHWRTVVSAFF